MAFHPPRLPAHRILLACAALPMLAGPIGTARAQTASPTLHTEPGFTALPETLSNSSKAQAPLTVHAGNWGVFNRLDGSPAGLGPVARYGVSRRAEDWSALRRPRPHDDPFDALKFIALNDARDIYLSLSGEAGSGTGSKAGPSWASRSRTTRAASRCATCSAPTSTSARTCASTAS